jgi:hypothetical protein
MKDRRTDNAQNCDSYINYHHHKLVDLIYQSNCIMSDFMLMHELLQDSIPQAN